MLRQLTSVALTATFVLGGASVAAADAGTKGSAAKSPGVLSGNAVQVPIHLPVQVCGNTVDIVGLLNPAIGKECKAK
ncbi:chaplin [Streptomyces sp. 3N207]|uniref:chaplin n=1 Tax=Streptomyces sp. 3N207 TaxID=3457417 RepID=UPI003FD3CF4A